MKSAIVPPFRTRARRTEHDYFSREGAQELCYIIREAWHDLGYKTLKVWAEPMEWYHRTKDRDVTLWVVRCNMIGGLPPKE